MGDPKKHRKKYKTPSHRWLKSRIESEKVITEQYGLKNKKEIYRFESKVRGFSEQAKKLIRDRGSEQARKEEKQLLDKLVRWGLLGIGCKIEDVLDLTVQNLLDRRLQTIVYRLGLAISVSQARQFIVHGHVFVNGKKVDVPCYIVLKSEEGLVNYNPGSSLNKEDHPERVKKMVIEKKEEVETDEKVSKGSVEAPKELVKEVNVNKLEAKV